MHNKNALVNDQGVSRLARCYGQVTSSQNQFD
ncbi:hypothetical protein VISI1226_01815 [Vibrio sinaloensis DSM 21326]|uniref:Uncharacterized protein n=1 Tax=Vibrio sinaloensis DSM 21326 TaxID=945550 RepID=E8M5M9_PHOS4|nr:hypothetical protein VISI1226_01815 [Vibrio sinaloensis DSM 21326]